MKIVKISNKKPPQWILDAVNEKFGVEWKSSVIFTYGELITSYTGMMTEDLLAHEPHHTKQQKEFGGADKWWKEYLKNNQFRFEQELECYRKQYQWVKRNLKNRNEVFNCLMSYAHALSGKLYGEIISFNEALKQIKKINEENKNNTTSIRNATS